MNFAYAPTLNSRKRADLLVIPFWKNKKQIESAADIGRLLTDNTAPIDLHDFSGDEGEGVIIYAKESQLERRILLLGLGDRDKIDIDSLRRASGSLVKVCRKRKIREINFIVPKKLPHLSEQEIVRGIADGLLSSNYAFTKLKGKQHEPAVLLSKVTFIGIGKKAIDELHKCSTIAESIYLVRDLVNDNADAVTPAHMIQIAQGLARALPKVTLTVFKKQRIAKEKMGLILAVSRASAHDPALLILHYKGNPRSKDNTVLVGKGITYDTGGLNLKITTGFGSMETMKCDMGGAAAVLGTIDAAAKLGLKANITAVVPVVENAIGPHSYKPGDVYTSYSGKTVEIISTDAEGRLVLADALAYAVKHLKPTRIIDLATLTGGVDIALGSDFTGMMSNDDKLANALIQAGEDSGDRLWRLPLHLPYREPLKSDFADLKNTGGRSAGVIKSALFLHEFIGDIPWAHCDIASTAYISDAKAYLPKHATGAGVKFLISFLETMEK